jgi:diadenosine tetraphosphate (Ap4A) HIT family hydrolase
MEKKCYFCGLSEQDNLSNLVAENKHAKAIFDDGLREGRCIVFLKKHKKSISQLDPKEYASVSELFVKVSRALEKKYNCEKTYLLSIGDQVEHIHFHLIPKHKDKCSLGVYCFEKLWEAEGFRKTAKSEVNTKAGELKNIIASQG